MVILILPCALQSRSGQPQVHSADPQLCSDGIQQTSCSQTCRGRVRGKHCEICYSGMYLAWTGAANICLSVQLRGKSDARFLETVLKISREIFSLRPSLTLPQMIDQVT